jgi:hypothetical protein
MHQCPVGRERRLFRQYPRYYEAYRTRLKSDADALANSTMAHDKRLILREERNFVEVVDGTFGIPSALAKSA